MNIQWQNSENIKINNTNTSAIIEDSSEVLSYFADKYIITKYKLATGDLVEYAGITYIVVSQIDRNYEGRKEDQYNYRARIRQADFAIKIVIGGKVEIIPSIIEGVKFDILGGNYISFSDDKILVTLQGNDITNKIMKQMRFIKLGSAWKITGIDKTKKGLIELICKSDVFGNYDDKENEIADTNLISDAPEEPIDPEEPEEPEEPTEPTEGVTYTITSIDAYDKTDVVEIWANSWAKFTVHKFIDDVEVSGTFTFEIDNINLATITVDGNTATITAKDVRRGGDVKLTIIDVDTSEIAIEKIIKIVGY